MKCCIAFDRYWAEILAMTTEAGFGKWASNSRLDFHEGRKIAIETERPRMPVSIDGELVSLQTPISLQIRRQALKVIMPVADEEPDASPTV